jgi:hypothetical protein
MINLETKVSYFNNIRELDPATNITLSDLFFQIKAPSTEIKNRLWKCRNTDAEKSVIAKQQLPAVTLSAVLKTRKADIPMEDKIESYTGLIQIDFDKVENIPGLKAKLEQDPFTVFVCISPSGTGVKTAIISPSIEQHQQVFLDAERYFLEKYKTKIDPSVKDIGRFMFLTTDPDLYVKPVEDWIYFEYPEIVDYPIAVEIRKPEKKENKKEYPSSMEIEKFIQTIEHNQIDITSNRGEWLKIAFAIINEYGEKGREYFHRISVFYPKYSRKESDNFYTSLMKSNRGKVGINTLYYLGMKHGLRFEKDIKPDNDFFVFWDFFIKKPSDLSETLIFSQTKVMQFLAFEGFGLWKHPDQERDPGFLCRVKNCIIEKSTVDLLRRHLLDYVNSLPDLVFDGITDGRNRVLDMIIQDNTLSPAKICALPFLTEKEHTNTISDGFYYFKNGFVKVNKEGAKLLPYNTIPAGFVVWKSSIINHDLDLLSGESTDFEQLNFVRFLMNLCTDKKIKKFHADKFKHLVYCLGYALFRPKSSLDLKALIITEFNLDPKKYQGRTGKTLLIRAIMKMLYPAIMQSGKGWNKNDKFRYQNVEPDCKLFALNDCQANLDFESFFTDITDGMQVEKKFEKGIYIFDAIRTPQMIFSCNYGIKNQGGSSEARRLDLEILPYYNKDFRPEHDLGRMIEDGAWNKDQWDMFYSFMIDCVHERILNPLPPKMDLDSQNLRQFKIETDTDFPDFAKENIKPGIFLDLVSICSTWCEFSGTNEKTFDKSKMGRWINRYADYLSLSGSGKYEYKKIRKRNENGSLVYHHIVDLFPHT